MNTKEESRNITIFKEIEFINFVLIAGSFLTVSFSGRGCDILALALDIAEKTAKKLGISYDDFCGMLKEGWNKEDSIAEKKFKDIFGDLFKE